MYKSIGSIVLVYWSAMNVMYVTELDINIGNAAQHNALQYSTTIH